MNDNTTTRAAITDKGNSLTLYSDGKLTIVWYKDTDNNGYYLCDENQNGALI